MTWLCLILFDQIVVFCQCSVAHSILRLIPSMLQGWINGNDSRDSTMTRETSEFYNNAMVAFAQWPQLPLTPSYKKEFVVTIAKQEDQGRRKTGKKR